MGTSSSYKGTRGSNPLIPSWLQGEMSPSQEPPSSEPSQPTNSDQVQPNIPLPPPVLGDPNRFRAARRYFSQAFHSGDRSYLRRAVSDYVSKGLGGSRSATKRLTTSTRAVSGVFGFVQDVRDRGFQEAAVAIGIGDLTGIPLSAAVAKLMEVFCPPGGGVDDSIARRSWNQTLLETVEQGVTDFSVLTTDEWSFMVESFIAHSIESRIYSDIGTGSIDCGSNVQEIDRLQQELHGLVAGAVHQAVGARLSENKYLTQTEVLKMVESIYKKTFDYLIALGQE